MGTACSKQDVPRYSTNDYELVIRSSKDLEWILEQEFDASGKGLHEKISSAAEKYPEELSPPLVKDMRYLATIRNKLVHERGFDVIPDRQRFIEKFELSQKELRELIAARRRRKEGKIDSSTDSICILM